MPHRRGSKKPLGRGQIDLRLADVRFGSEADIGARPRHVRFTPESGHSVAHLGCPLCATSGHGMLRFGCRAQCLGSYFGGDGMAEEWWSTMSQSSPRFTYVKL